MDLGRENNNNYYGVSDTIGWYLYIYGNLDINGRVVREGTILGFQQQLRNPSSKYGHGFPYSLVVLPIKIVTLCAHTRQNK